MSVAVVTGAGAGIGAAIVKRLRSDGWDVWGVDLKGDVDLHVDLTERDANRLAVETAVERYGTLDAVIPSAGVQHVSPVEDFPEDRWDAMLSLMLTSPFLLARYAWPHLRRSEHARFESPWFWWRLWRFVFRPGPCGPGGSVEALLSCF